MGHRIDLVAAFHRKIGKRAHHLMGQGVELSKRNLPDHFDVFLLNMDFGLVPFDYQRMRVINQMSAILCDQLKHIAFVAVALDQSERIAIRRDEFVVFAEKAVLGHKGSLWEG